MKRRVGLLALAVLSIALVACFPFGGDNTITVKGVFGDISDLSLRAQVSLADVSVGKVTKIKLIGSGTHSRALITMEINKSAHVPADVVAEVRRTSPLGEKYISLTPHPADGRTGELKDGTTLSDTRVIGDIQDLVQAGTRLFGAFSASDVATILNESATAFAGKGPELHHLIAQLTKVTTAYADRTPTFVRVINNINQLTTDLAPHSAAIAQLLDNVATTTDILNQESDRTFGLVRSVNRLLSRGNDLLRKHLEQFITNVHALADFTGILREHTSDIVGLLQTLPKASTILQLIGGHYGFPHGEFDILACGVPGFYLPGDPSQSC